MSEKVVITLAVGDSIYGEFALNLAMSIKATTPNQKILLIYDESAIKTIKPFMDKFFDIGHQVYETNDNPAETAFYLKTQLMDIVIKACPNFNEAIFLDADLLMLAGRRVDEWFDKHQNRHFSMYCNDVYDYVSKKRTRKDYTFWCNPEDTINGLIDINPNYAKTIKKFPQCNSSFIYFKATEHANEIFGFAKGAWKDTKIDFQKYRGAKPDEFCFNVACAITGCMPSEKPQYRPVFFQFASETQNTEYIMQYFKCFGFAGVQKPLDYILDFYNNQVEHYNRIFGLVRKFRVSDETKQTRDTNPIVLRPTRKRTLFRKGEVENSNGGIFNPSSIQLEDGTLMTIFRKEKDLSAYKMEVGNTGLPHVHFIGEKEEREFELTFYRYPENVRCEDFRLFKSGPTVFCNHKIITDPRPESREMKTCLSMYDEANGGLYFMEIPDLPIQLMRTDINWCFFSEGDFFYCVYKLNPYTVFISQKYGSSQWTKLETPEYNLDWFHKEQFICNSTNPVGPIKIDGIDDRYYVMMFHTKEGGIYFHGACLINARTKGIEYATKNSIYLDVNKDGLHKGLVYVSGMVYFEERNVLRVLIGESDTHSSYVEFNAKEFIDAIIVNSLT